jgi:hypothetical protein
MAPELYYSKYCPHSTEILELINKAGVQSEFVYTSIDKRVVSNNITYLVDNQNNHRPLPPMINRVPVLVISPSEILHGQEIADYIKPQSKTLSEEAARTEFDHPNPFTLGKDTSLTGVTSDTYSFLDTSPEDLLAEHGNGGLRQMYNYAPASGEIQTVNAPFETKKEQKLTQSLEQIEQERNQSLAQIESKRQLNI